MYIPDLYKNDNQADIEQFIKNNGFALVINQSAGELFASHLPLVFETHEPGKKTLTGHLSIENPQATIFKENDSVLVVFSGPHAYISSSWYDHENVPTWNYIAVHVYGKIKILNLDQTIDSLKTLVDKYEANSDNPIKVENLSTKTMRQARAIVGFEIEITKIEAQKKLSQNRDESNHQNIINQLKKINKLNEIEIAEEMKKCSICPKP